MLDYFWTATSGGLSRSHYSDGRVIDTEYKLGDTKHFAYQSGEDMIHALHYIDRTKLSFVTVEFKQSANSPLQL